MEKFVIKMDANVNNPNLPVLTNSFSFILKKISSDTYPVTKNTNPGASYIKNLKLSTKSGNAIFSSDGVTYKNTVNATSIPAFINYISLTQDEEIEATILDSKATSNIYLANYTTLAIDISFDSLMYCEEFGLPSGAGSSVHGTELDLWNPNIQSLNISNIIENNIDLSDYILFNNGTLTSWFNYSNKVTFDLRKLDENPMFNGKTLYALVSYDKPQMIYTGQPTDIIKWNAKMHYFAFKDVASAKNWFLALANSPDAIAGLKNVRFIASGFVWDEDCLTAKNTIITQLTQEYINSCANFTVFGQNWKQ